jgi:hypothetical protein
MLRFTAERHDNGFSIGMEIETVGERREKQSRQNGQVKKGFYIPFRSHLGW